MLMVYLSGVAPDYRQRIQVMGDSTGNLPAMEMSLYLNTTYADARYAANRVTLLDAVCEPMEYQAKQYSSHPVAGEQAWVDNYVSNDPNYSRAAVLPGTLNVVCRPSQNHAYPLQRYESSSLQYTNGGLVAFGYLSVIGDGKNYQLNTQTNVYYFLIDSILNTNLDLLFFNQAVYPGRILAPVQLTGPADGATLGSQGAVLGCQAVENAVGYQLLLGTTPDRVMDYTMVSETTNPPQQTVTALAQANTWWTVRAYDQFGSTIYADPRRLSLPASTTPVANAGPTQILFAGPDGEATVTLDGSKSTGAALNYVWAWAVGTNVYLTNGVSVTIELPIGVSTVQLMVNNGLVNSQPAATTIAVVAGCSHQSVDAGTDCTASAAISAGFAGAESGPFTVVQSPPGPYPVGTNLVSLIVSDGHGATNTCAAEVVVVDRTPPELTCPGNQTAEFTSAAGAEVNFTPQASDRCSPPATVACQPASGSVFPIGATEVQCTASDTAGNAARCSFQVTILGAEGVTSNALAQLIGLQAKRYPWPAGSELDKAVKGLSAALTPAFWTDQAHLARDNGETVFNDGTTAVQALLELNPRRSSTVPEAVWQSCMARLMKADRLLAFVAIEDAGNAGVRSQALAAARSELAQGDAAAALGLYPAAIEHYGNAWRIATRAQASK
jgi:hypothetical protein